jgi:isoquinoline 1-oxidoreductase alpha subunit
MIDFHITLKVIMPIEFTVNQRKQVLNVPDDTPILWVLREELGLTGTKFGCGKGLCGACTIHLNGSPVRACSIPISAAIGSEISTIEGLSDSHTMHAVQQAWLDLDVVQCGYCQPGQIMSAAALLKKVAKPDSQMIDEAMNGNLCRCGTYPRIRAAINRAIELIEKEPKK